MDKISDAEDFDLSLERRFHKIKSLITKFLRHSEFDLKKPNIFSDNILKSLYFQNLCAGEIMNVLIENNLKHYCDVIKHLFASQQIVMKNIVNSISEHLFDKENLPINKVILNSKEISYLKKKRKKKFKEIMKKVNFKNPDKNDKKPIERFDENNIIYEIKEKKKEATKKPLSELDEKAFKALKLLNSGLPLTKKQLRDPLLLLRVNKLLSSNIISSHLLKYNDINKWMDNSSKILNHKRHFKDVKNRFECILNDMKIQKDRETPPVFKDHDKIMKFSEFEEAVKIKIENGYYLLFERILNYLRREKIAKECQKHTQTEMTHIILDKQFLFMEQKKNKNLSLINNLTEEVQYYKNKFSEMNIQNQKLNEKIKNLLKTNEDIHFRNEKLQKEIFFDKTNKNKLKNEMKGIKLDKTTLESKFRKSLNIISCFKKNLIKIFSKVNYDKLNFNDFQEDILGLDRILADCTFSVENYCYDLINKIKNKNIFINKRNSSVSNKMGNDSGSQIGFFKKQKKSTFGFSTNNINSRKKQKNKMRNSYSLFLNNKNESYGKESLINKSKEFNRTKHKFRKSKKKSLEINLDIGKINKIQTLYTKKFINNSEKKIDKTNFSVKNKKVIKINKNYKKNYYLKKSKKSNSMVLIPKLKKRVLRLSLFNVNNSLGLQDGDKSYNNNFNSDINEKKKSDDLKKIVNNCEEKNIYDTKINNKIIFPGLKNKKNREFEIEMEEDVLEDNFNFNEKNKIEKKNKLNRIELNIVFVCKTCSTNPKTNEIMKFFKRGKNLNKESEVIGKTFNHLETFKFYKKLKKIFEKRNTKQINNDLKNNKIEKKLNFSRDDCIKIKYKKDSLDKNISFLSKKNQLVSVNSNLVSKKKKSENNLTKKIDIESKSKILSNNQIEKKISNSEIVSTKFIPKQKIIKDIIDSDLNIKKIILSNLLKDMRINNYHTNISYQKNLYLMEINKMINSNDDKTDHNFQIMENPNIEPINFYLKKIYMVIYSIKFKKISKTNIIHFQNQIVLGSNSSLNVSGKKISTEFILSKILNHINKFNNNLISDDLKKKSEILIESFINFHKECKPNCNHLDNFYDFLKKYIKFRLEQKIYPISKIFFGGSIKN